MPILALITLSAWGFSSPVGSAPDDDFHLASIWCGAGTQIGECTITDAKSGVVPRDLLVNSTCYAFKPAESASCQGPGFGTHQNVVVSSARGNFDGTYPPVYYFVMNAFVGPNVDISVLLMRIANSVLFVGFFTGLFFLLPRHRRATLMISLMICVVPLGLFIIPSVNPSGWAVLSGGGVFLSLLGFFETTGRRRIGLAAMAIVATVIGAGARADAAAYAILAAAAALVMTFTPTRAFLLKLILPAVVGIISLGLYLSARQSAAVGAGMTAPGGPVREPRALLASILLNVSDLWVGAFGRWGLGWLDTQLPAVVWISAWGIFAAVVFAGLGSRMKRKPLAVALVFAALWLVPSILLFTSRAVVGETVQPRYLLPLILLFATVCLVRRSGEGFSPSRTQITVLIGALSLAAGVSLHFNIRRYVTGNDVGGWNLNTNAEWWWNIPVSPNMVWVIGSLAFAGMLTLICGGQWLAAGNRTRVAPELSGSGPVQR